MTMSKRTRNAVVKTLEAARARIAAGWTQGTPYARDAAGEEVHYGGSEAASWTLQGALLAGLGVLEHETLFTASYRYLALALRDGIDLPHWWYIDLVRWNDAPERTQEEVLAAFDRAIELAKAGAEVQE